MNNIYKSTSVSEELAARLRAMPKTEIHVHLEGAVDAETIYMMAQRNKRALPVSSLEAWKKFYEFGDFDHFIEVYILAASCLQTPEDYIAMTENFLERQAAQNIKYSEAYFSPTLHLANKTAMRDILLALKQGAESGQKKTGSSVRFIADISRESSHEKYKVLAFALEGMEMGHFIGLGVGGPERGNPPENYADVFEVARNAGLRVVAHAGEADGPQSIWGALQYLKAERIGHGTRIFEDETVAQYVTETQVPMEVSPNSNYCLKIIKPDEPHPIRRMYDEGMYVTLNSDDPPMFSTDLNNEYLTLAAQGFTWDELWKINRNSLNATFLSESEKEELRKEWDQFLQDHS
jgi:adenosine deaminase